MKECRSKGTALSLMSVCDKWKASCDAFTIEMGNNDFGILKRSDFRADSLKKEGWLYFAKGKSNPTNRFGRKL